MDKLSFTSGSSLSDEGAVTGQTGCLTEVVVVQGKLGLWESVCVGMRSSFLVIVLKRSLFKAWAETFVPILTELTRRLVCAFERLILVWGKVFNADPGIDLRLEGGLFSFSSSV